MPNDTALHKSCHNGELDAVQRLIEGGEFEVNEGGEINGTRRTKLWQAGQDKMPDISLFLMHLNLYTTYAAGAGDRRPLHRAAGSNHVEVCRYLIDKGAKVDQVCVERNARNGYKYTHQ